VRESGCGTLRPKAGAAARPQLAEADVPPLEYLWRRSRTTTAVIVWPPHGEREAAERAHAAYERESKFRADGAGRYRRIERAEVRNEAEPILA
jgi:hypothetical protein